MEAKNWIERTLFQRAEARFFLGKAVVVTGPRQVGKTSLCKRWVGSNAEALWLTGDDPDTSGWLQSLTTDRWEVALRGKRFLVIDEAQLIPEVGRIAKRVVDFFPNVQVFLTGSSSVLLSGAVNESLTGRKWEFTLLPFSRAEMQAHFGVLQEQRMLPERLVYGAYPEVVLASDWRDDRLKLLADSYLYRDILAVDSVLRPEALVKLVRALAFQVGSLVSYHELAQLAGLDAKTVERYIDLLEKAYVVFRVGAFSGNLRSELKRAKKVYFYDNGIRNAVLGDLRPLEMRSDVGALWENYALSERRKALLHRGQSAEQFFWRTKDGVEWDWVERTAGSLKAWECKWNDKARPKRSRAFEAAYPEAETGWVTPSLLDDFLADGAPQ
jgi:predicted AAA+ superfamily ATPase